MTDGEEDPLPKDTVGSVLKACQLLHHFSPTSPSRTLADLTELTGFSKTTVHRLLSTLVRGGWLVRHESGAYMVSMSMFRIGAAALSGSDLRITARPFLQRLADRFGDTAYLMVPADEGAICIDKVEGANPLTVATIGLGTVLPFHAAAGPSVLLAYSQQLRQRWLAGSLPSFTDRTITDRQRLEERLEEVRKAGYSFSDEDYLPGVAAVAAPVVNEAGAAIATLSLGGHARNFRGSQRKQIIEAVCAAAQQLSEATAIATA